MKDVSARKKARQIAKLFNIEVVYERGLYSYWVEGPKNIYGGREPREDPLEWNHVMLSGHSVLTAVSLFAWDIACHRANVSHEIAMEVWRACERSKLLALALRKDVAEICQAVDLFLDKDPRIITWLQ